MTDQQQTEAGLKSLYQITGEISDINTILVNRGEFHRLQVDLERERMRLFACGVVAMADTPDSAREARAMHPDYESASCDDVKRRVDECIALRARVAELEDVLTNLPLSSPQRLRARIQRLEEMLAAVGAGGVGPLMPVTVQHQHESSSDNELQRKTGDLITTAAPPQSGGIPPDWKLVPVKPTRGMLDAARKDLVRDAEIDPMLKGIHSAMLDAAPQPQGEQEICCKIWSVNRIDDLGKIVDSSGRLIATVYGLQAEKIVACHNSHAKQKPQNEQEPVAWIENVEGGIGYNPYHEAARKLPDGVRFDLYVHPQNLRCKSTQARLAALWGYVKAEPLTDEQIAAATGAKPGIPMWLVAVAFTRAIERAHEIGSKA